MFHPSNQSQEYVVGGWGFPGRRCPKIFRVLLRAEALAVWTFICYLAMRGLFLATPRHSEKRKCVAKIISRRLVSVMRGLFGIRLMGAGKILDHPYFLVVNHHIWVEYFGINVILDARLVVMAEDAAFPVVGLLTRGLDTIFTDRTRKSVPVVNRQLIASIRRKESVMIAPEGAVTPVHTICRYRGALLEAAVATSTLVHYATVHWRTAGLPAAFTIRYLRSGSECARRFRATCGIGIGTLGARASLLTASATLARPSI